MAGLLMHANIYWDRLLSKGVYVVLCLVCAPWFLWGETIQNSATLHYTYITTNLQVQSNTVSDPIVDANASNGLFTLSCSLSQALEVTQGQPRAALPFTLKNRQSSSAVFTLSLEANSTNIVDNAGLFTDSNGNGTYDTGTDVSVSTISLGAGATQTLFFVSDIPSGASWSFSANGLTASDNNTTPPVEASALCLYTLKSNTLLPDKRLKVVKSASLSSNHLYRGSMMHYIIRIEALDTAVVTNPVFVDTIPSGTTFVPGSVSLDGNRKPDNQVYDGSSVKVTLPDMSKGDVHTVTFAVKVN